MSGPRGFEIFADVHHSHQYKSHKAMLQDEQQNNASGDAQGQAENIQEREKFVLQGDTDKEFEGSAEHCC
jgi:hypothetical protein